MKIEDSTILVSIGAKREGIIPPNDLKQMGDEFVSALRLGQTLQVYVQDPENREGELVLSLTMVQVARDWEYAARLQEDGGIVEAIVIGYNKGGLLIQFNRIRGFVPASQVAQLHGRTAAEERQQALQRMVGQTIPLKVIEVDRERNRLVLSERSAIQEWRKAQRHRLLTELQPGDILNGRVNQLTNFGAFIDLGGADGLVHISELSWQRVNHPREVLSPGQEVKVMVVEIDAERERIGLSIRRLQANPWETIDQRYSLGQLVSGSVTNVAPFGAFVQIEEAVEGLIHASELDSDPQTQPRDLLQPGQTITAMIISLDKQRQRMGLSLLRISKDSPTFTSEEEVYQTAELEPLLSGYARIEQSSKDRLLDLNRTYTLIVGVQKNSDHVNTITQFQDITFEVAIHAIDVNIQPSWHQECRLIGSDHFKSVFFSIQPTTVGIHQVRIDYLYNRHWLAMILLELNVVERLVGSGHSNE